MAKIMVVDEDDRIRALFAKLLKGAGHTIRMVPEGDEAMQVFNSFEPDLVITDVLAQHKQLRLAMIQEIKSKRPDIKLIALSGGGPFEVSDAAVSADVFGADKVFTKPLAGANLLSAVNDLLTIPARVAVH